MAEMEGQEKTEQASSKKLNDGREKGQVAKSVEINSLAVFGTGTILIYLTQSGLGENVSKFSISILSKLDKVTIAEDQIISMIWEWFGLYAVITLPILLSIMVIALGVNIAQVGFKISIKAMAPKASKLNPFKGIKKIIFSSRSLVEVSKSLFKLLVIGLFSYILLEELIEKSTNLLELSIVEIVRFMIESSFSLLWKIMLVYVIIAFADFAYQRFKFKKDMMMTKQELKEENKQVEGDPFIKSRIKKMQYEIAGKRMIHDIPNADVVITNPTHYAIAVKYDMNKDAAPKVIAKGMDELARRIKKIALENGIPIHEDKELARALYKTCNTGDEIPVELFKAVAQILAYFYQLKRNGRKRIV